MGGWTDPINEGNVDDIAAVHPNEVRIVQNFEHADQTSLHHEFSAAGLDFAVVTRRVGKEDLFSGDFKDRTTVADIEIFCRRAQIVQCSDGDTVLPVWGMILGAIRGKECPRLTPRSYVSFSRLSREVYCTE